MVPSSHSSAVKVVGAKGQISLGRQYAGRALVIIPPTSFSPEVAGPLQNMVLRA